MREFSTIEEASEFLDVPVEQMIAWRDSEDEQGPKITDVGNQERCYQRRDLNLFKRDMLGQSGL